MTHDLNFKERRTQARAFVIALAFVVFPLAASAQEIQWTFAPYLWGPGIDSSLFVDNSSLIDKTTPVDDLFEKTDFAAMVYLEGRRDNFGLYGDVLFLNTGATQTKSGAGIVQSGTEFKSDLKSTIIDTVFFFRPGGGERGLDFLLGARIADMAAQFDITPPKGASEHLSSSDTLVDALVGLRYTAMLGEKWDMALRGDVGGGGSELSWNVQAGVGWWYSKSSSVRFGWKHMAIDFQTDANGQNVELDTTMSGPYIGWMFRN